MRSGPPRFQLVVLVFGALASLDAAADAPPDVPVERVESGEGSERLFSFEYSGYLRWRNDLFYRGDLGAAVGGIRTPLENSDKNADLGESSDVIAGANMRFRFAPTIHVGQMFRIHAMADVLDNIVLGSSTDYHPDRADVSIAMLADGQAGVGDAIAVKRLWLEWELFHGIVFSAGRMSHGFGLGMVTSSGDGLDSDFGDSTDRVSLMLRGFGLHSEWFFDSPFEGATSQSRLDGFGQASDLGSVDDAIRWGFTFGQKAQDPVETEKNRRDLLAGKPVLQWVIKNSFTTHDFDSVAETDPVRCTADEPAFASDCVQLFPREASLWIPDAWLRLDWRPRHDVTVRIELELAGIVGDVEFVQNIPDVDSTKEILAMGGVLQAQVDHRSISYHLEFGAASGDDVAFGSYGPGFTNPVDFLYAQDDRLRNNRTVTRFLFSRDYRVDLLLYREVLGTVTDSFYLKPKVEARLIDTDDLRIGGSLSLLYAHAFLADPTPGQANPLGFETDINLFVEQGRHLRVDLDVGFLVPFSGLDNASAGRSAKTAFTAQARIGISF